MFKNCSKYTNRRQRSLNVSNICVLLNRSYCKTKNGGFFPRDDVQIGVSELAAAYVPHKVEAKCETRGYFEPRIVQDKQFNLILPPPNITGTLHLGHALTVTIQDVLVRWNRMRGMETVWVPGMDHAGIATQVMVEKRLWSAKRQTRHDLGRDAFEKEIWRWKHENAGTIDTQLKRLGALLDWDKEVFTMNPAQSQAVIAAFIKLFNSGLIYRSDYLINWSCVLQSAISDIEVEHMEISGRTDITVPGYGKPVQFGTITKFAYKLDSSDEEIVVATTRPETMVGDVAVAVHPEDHRYSSYIGRRVWHPFRNETIPIICDNFVDREFKTGAVKLTPGHNQSDFEVANRHALNILSVINEKGFLTCSCGEFSGLPRFEARDAVVCRLDGLGLLRGIDDHAMTVPICSRSRDVVELLVKPQWFVRCRRMAETAVRDVREGRLTIVPPDYENVWFNWLENIKDWCVSRQLWWGHRVPAYLCHVDGNDKRKEWIAAEGEEEARAKAGTVLGVDPNKIIAKQDVDVLDTWFSSALLPFSAFGWPEQSKDLSKHYPLSLMETGHDILFFWVARMVMLGTELTGKLPFDKILLHGIVCDAHGRKMSKSVGNVVTPENVIDGASLQELAQVSEASQKAGLLSEEELGRVVEGQRKLFPEGIPKCGIDALRFTLCSYNIKRESICFDVDQCNANRLFGNKIWQATKFTILSFDKVLQFCKMDEICNGLPTPIDEWILSRLTKMVESANRGMANSDFHVVTAALKDFLYFDFCDVYLECTKIGLRNPKTQAAIGHCWTLLQSLDVGLRVLAPFMPNLAQHLHRHLPLHPNLVARDFPENVGGRNLALERDVQVVLDMVVGIRRLKKQFEVVKKHKPTVNIITDLQLYHDFADVIKYLSGCDQLLIGTEPELTAEETVSDKAGSTTFLLVLPGELKRGVEVDSVKLAKKLAALNKELHKLQKMVASEGYRLKAPVDVQQNHQRKITLLDEQLARINYMMNICNK